MNLLTLLLALAVSTIKFAQGLDNERNVLPSVNPWLIAKSLLVSIFLVPILFLILILICKPTLPITCTLIIMACSPMTNLSNQSIGALGGDLVLTNHIERITSLVSIITTPALLELLKFLLNINLSLSPSIIIEQLVITQFIPTSLGLFLGKKYPKYIPYAKSIIRWASWLLIITFGLLIMRNFQSFSQLRIRGYMAVMVATITAFFMGIFFAGKDTKQQISLSLETGLRNPGLAYLIASENFIEANANIIMLPYTVTLLVSILLCVYFLKSFHQFVRRK